MKNCKGFFLAKGKASVRGISKELLLLGKETY